MGGPGEAAILIATRSGIIPWRHFHHSQFRLSDVTAISSAAVFKIESFGVGSLHLELALLVIRSIYFN
jgi:hypothetical protein